MGAVQTISTNYTPHAIQRHFHRRMKRFNVMVCHRRFGKTVMAVSTLIIQSIFRSS